MSVPLPPPVSRRRRTRQPDAKVHIHDLFLDPDERYEVFVVKAAERPHLCLYDPSKVEAESKPQVEARDKQDNKDDNFDANDKENSDGNDENDQDNDTPFLMDGCDIGAWRQTFAPSLPAHQVAIWNIGSASALFRRERQWTHLSFSLSMERWHRWKRFLSRPPSTSAPRLLFQECRRAVTPEKDETRFAVQFERQNRPATILGATKGWKAMPEYPTPQPQNQQEAQDTESNALDFAGGGVGGWTFAELLRRFGSFRFRFSDTHGEMLTLETYAKYITGPEGLWDDSPLGIYDSEFGSDATLACLVDEYTVPDCFSPDLFALAAEEEGEDDDDHEEEEDKKNDNDIPDNACPKEDDSPSSSSSRPPYRWILIGPPRSGTGLHIDPLWTNAWVTVLQGRKRWMLFPPATPPEAVGMVEGKPQIASSIWFHDYYEKVTSEDWPEAWRPVEILQVPGETVFVPQGWMHLVLNLDLTVAVTHNYATDCQLERQWHELCREESAFGKRWIRGLQQHGRIDVLKHLWESMGSNNPIHDT